jgi:Tol biopolymer transport system component
MARQTVLLQAAVVAAVLVVACAAAVLLAVSEKAEAAVPGENGRIAFSAKESTADAQYQIYTIKPDGTGEKQLTNTSSRYFNIDPVFSPDGTKIAWNRSSDIWIMNANGTGKKRLVVGGEDPAFSPDGTKIAFRYEAGQDIWTINPDGSGLANVTNTPSVVRSEFTPDWASKPATAG